MKLKDNEYYVDSGISNSGISLINPDQGGSPELYLAVNKGEMEKKENLSLERGKLVHLFMLEPDSFKVADVNRPSDGIAKVIEHLASVKNSKFNDKNLLLAAKTVDFRKTWGDAAKLKEINTKDSKIYFDYLRLPEEYVIINQVEKSVIDSSIQSIKAHPYANYLIFSDEWDGVEAINEVPLKYFDYEYGLHLKGLLDRLVVVHKEKKIIIADLKTTSKPVDSFFGSYVNYRYYRQHAYYGNLVKNVYKDLIDRGYHIEYKSVVVNINPKGLFQTRVFDIHPDFIQMGSDEYKNLLSRIVFHNENGWYAPKEHILNEKLTGRLEHTLKPL